MTKAEILVNHFYQAGKFNLGQRDKALEFAIRDLDGFVKWAHKQKVIR